MQFTYTKIPEDQDGKGVCSKNIYMMPNKIKNLLWFPVYILVHAMNNAKMLNTKPLN